MKVLVLLMIVFSMVSCSHHHNKAEHHHHQFDKKCAYEISQNHFDVEGKDEFKIEHDGQTYYFSSLENMQKFQSDIDENIKKSKSNWRSGPPSSRSR